MSPHGGTSGAGIWRVVGIVAVLLTAYSAALATIVFRIHENLFVLSCFFLFTMLVLPFILFATLRQFGVHRAACFVHALLIFISSIGGGRLVNTAVRSAAINSVERGEPGFRILIYKFERRGTHLRDDATRLTYFDAPNAWYQIGVEQSEAGTTAWLTD